MCTVGPTVFNSKPPRNSHLDIDQASFSRRSTVSTPSGDTSNSWESNTLLPYITWKLLLVISPSCFAACGRNLSPRIAMVSSLPLHVAFVHFSQFLFYQTSRTFVVNSTFFLLCEFYSLLFRPTLMFVERGLWRRIPNK